MPRIFTYRFENAPDHIIRNTDCHRTDVLCQPIGELAFLCR